MPVEDFTIQRAQTKRISDSTRKGYASGLRQIRAWIQETDLLYLLRESDSGEQIIDLNVFKYDHFKEFITHTMRSKDIEPNTLSKYKVQSNRYLKEILSGIRKMHAEKLQSGEN
ncbi:hypothetical protein Ae201684_007284 [Aphanomyces euteiches]|uniref:Core-binding (CB) domain-containing protein n=1 Tax=Aphanomyces euteiches TaxID=100861 RepID=A0A6G0X8I5_9STRA|nr:hypothetical protein Ae201684_007284 [Aphanomyces euteiches]